VFLQLQHHVDAICRSYKAAARVLFSDLTENILQSQKLASFVANLLKIGKATAADAMLYACMLLNQNSSCHTCQ
jgi:hypothetical protein